MGAILYRVVFSKATPYNPRHVAYNYETPYRNEARKSPSPGLNGFIKGIRREYESI